MFRMCKYYVKLLSCVYKPVGPINVYWPRFTLVNVDYIWGNKVG